MPEAIEPRNRLAGRNQRRIYVNGAENPSTTHARATELQLSTCRQRSFGSPPVRRALSS